MKNCTGEQSEGKRGSVIFQRRGVLSWEAWNEFSVASRLAMESFFLSVTIPDTSESILGTWTC